jgi:hypothetical protein
MSCRHNLTITRMFGSKTCSWEGGGEWSTVGSNIKLKNAYHLQEYYKDFKHEMHTPATPLADVRHMNQSLGRE